MRWADRRRELAGGSRKVQHPPNVRSLLMAAGIALLQPVAAPAQSTEKVESELEQLREDIRDITERLERERDQRRNEQAALRRIEQKLARLALELRATRESLDQAREREQTLAARAGRLETATRKRRAELAEQLQIAYRVGQRSRLKALLDLEDPAEISRVLALHGYLGRARMDAIAQLAEELSNLRRVRAEQRALALELQALAERQAAARSDQDEALQARRAVLEALEDSIRNRTEKLAEMRESAEELEALLEDLADALADIPPEIEIEPFANHRGELPMPLSAPVRATFADRRSGDVTWQGWLIGAEVGQPVRAVAYGRVAYADWLRGYGMMLIIEHGDGYMTLYGQNQSLIAEVGDWVAPGDVIALAGNTGGNSAPGLYFQIRHAGRPVDPAVWISR
jgi:murein hydrolase activator